MITLDNTKGRIAQYEVVLEYGELKMKCYHHYYSDARIQFMSCVNAHIKGLTVRLNDLTGDSDKYTCEV